MAESQNPDEWRGGLLQRLKTLERDIAKLQENVDREASRLQDNMDQHHKIMTALIEQLITRLQPLEQLRAMILGGTVIILALSPVLWWLLTRAVYVAEKLPGKP